MVYVIGHRLLEAAVVGRGVRRQLKAQIDYKHYLSAAMTSSSSIPRQNQVPVVVILDFLDNVFLKFESLIVFGRASGVCHTHHPPAACLRLDQTTINIREELAAINPSRLKTPMTIAMLGLLGVFLEFFNDRSGQLGQHLLGILGC